MSVWLIDVVLVVLFRVFVMSIMCGVDVLVEMVIYNVGMNLKVYEFVSLFVFGFDVFV